MPLIIRSPYSGKPVKIRDEDVSRAIRDEENRIFYVVPRSDGQGYYAAPTRKGSEKDEQRYLALESKTHALDGGAEQAATRRETIAVHDATGRRRANPLRRAAALIIALLLAAAGLYGVAEYTDWLDPFLPITPSPTQPQDVEEPDQPDQTGWHTPAPQDEQRSGGAIRHAADGVIVVRHHARVFVVACCPIG